jgi:precorrin-6B methylase 2
MAFVGVQFVVQKYCDSKKTEIGVLKMRPEEAFNGYVITNFCVLLHEAQIFELFLNGDKSISEAGFVRFVESKNQKLPLRAHELIDFGVRFSIFERSKRSSLRLSQNGISWLDNRAFAVWLIGGYGAYLRKTIMCSLNQDTEAHKTINGEYVAIGSQMANQSFMKDVFLDLLDEYSPKSLVDLGCGVGARLVTSCQNDSECFAYGIDINKDAVKLANARVRSNNLSERVKILHGDALERGSELGRSIDRPIDVVMSFMSMHDIFNIYGPRESARRIISNFNRPGYIWVADTVKSDSDLEQPLPIFTSGFELVHAFQKIDLFNKEIYIDAFESAGARLVEQRYLNVPNTYAMIFKTGEPWAGESIN